MKNLILIIMLITATSISAQFDLPGLEQIESVELKVYWGDVTVLGGDREKASMEVNYTDDKNNKRELSLIESREFVSVEIKDGVMEISVREPSTFESVDITLFLPRSIHVKIEHIRGGEIYIDDLGNGLEINQRNGSLVAEGISKYAMINLANGSIDISLDNVDPELPISLITLNGEVKVTLPAYTSRDIRLISEKNGYVISDFELTSVTDIPNLNRREYSKQPIKGFAEINGGGSLLFMSTQNGPIIIKEN